MPATLRCTIEAGKPKKYFSKVVFCTEEWICLNTDAHADCSMLYILYIYRLTLDHIRAPGALYGSVWLCLNSNNQFFKIRLP